MRITIPKVKAELPMLVVGLLIDVALSLMVFARFGWKAFAIFLLFSLILLWWVYKKRKGEYFIEVDQKGVRWRQNLISTFIDIPWEYIQRIDYLVYEINFKIKESGQVVSFPTSNISDHETEKLKQTISDFVSDRLPNN